MICVASNHVHGGGLLDPCRRLRRAPGGSSAGGHAGPRPITVGADKGYETSNFAMDLRKLGAVPRVAQHPPAGAQRSTAAPPPEAQDCQMESRPLLSNQSHQFHTAGDYSMLRIVSAGSNRYSPPSLSSVSRYR
jgi:hypothetical protein